MKTRSVAVDLGFVLLVLAAPAASWADDAAPAPGRTERFQFGGGVLVGSPTGEFSRQVGTGGGATGHFLWAPGGVLSLRGDGSLFFYGREAVRVPVSSSLPRISTEVTTDNWIGRLSAGPQLMARSGRVRPYVHAFAGVSYFSTSSEATDPFFLAPIAYATNYDDYVFSYGAGGGLLIGLGRGRVSLDLGARYVANGRVSYLAQGDIRDDGKGGVSFTPRRSRADLVEIRVGVSIWR